MVQIFSIIASFWTLAALPATDEGPVPEEKAAFSIWISWLGRVRIDA